ncbi:hypothetical protein Q5741_12060 [Paenibacillus sp. JX-17]|uniref:Helix-turn-helix domain-containing protein n=1 Tax=Paenibacillus lacisoli TaxID=3064525 RepID=A0ABT9CCZ3_9BACL|nr:hypothetical protein [Paenibacillus sp. JX-17]MDO7907143.1 hypothetical protein [Paenibacillus sp. JX-17]
MKKSKIIPAALGLGMMSLSLACGTVQAAASASYEESAAVVLAPHLSNPALEKESTELQRRDGDETRGTRSDQRRRRGRAFFSLDQISAYLKMTPDQLRSELHSGKSLAEIAKAKGISEQALINEIKDKMTEDLRRFVNRKAPAHPGVWHNQPGKASTGSAGQ